MTNAEQNCQTELSWHCGLIKNGGWQTNVDQNAITQSLRLLETMNLAQCPVFDVVNSKASHTTKITTSLWMLCGYVSHAINNAIKKWF
jgi:hypothetical protein